MQLWYQVSRLSTPSWRSSGRRVILLRSVSLSFIISSLASNSITVRGNPIYGEQKSVFAKIHFSRGHACKPLAHSRSLDIDTGGIHVLWTVFQLVRDVPTWYTWGSTWQDPENVSQPKKTPEKWAKTPVPLLFYEGASPCCFMKGRTERDGICRCFNGWENAGEWWKGTTHSTSNLCTSSTGKENFYVWDYRRIEMSIWWCGKCSKTWTFMDTNNH